MDEHSIIKLAKRSIIKKLLLKCGLFILPVIISIVVFIGVLFIVLIVAVEEDNNSMQWSEDISEYGLAEIPPEYLPIYYKAGAEYNVPWNLLAAIHKVETDFGRNLSVSSAGAVGHMQFMPKTWVGWSYPGSKVSDSDLVSLAAIAKYGGYGVDADNDGRADPYNAHDAIHAAANYLSASGASDGDYYKAVYAYNHADWYVQKVLELAELYVTTSTSEIHGNYSGNAVADVGLRWIGRSTYVFGGGRTDENVANGVFDCSSFVWWCFNENGIKLGERSGVNTESLNKMGTRISISEAQAGDLIFLDTYKVDGHVVIYRGDGTAIGCQSSTGVGIISLTSGYYARVFKGHVRRI